MAEATIGVNLYEMVQQKHMFLVTVERTVLTENWRYRRHDSNPKLV